ncbi:MAG: protein kinase domain-containing protein [Planctomycetota bacterium]
MDKPIDPSERLDQILDEFLNDLKENRQPTLELYQAKYPDLAEQLADLLPMVASLHQNASNPNPTTVYPILKPESILGEYQILREIGRGGMGIVYEAKQLGLDRIVALKIRMVDPSDSPAIQAKKQTRFLREAKLCSNLQHPHIIPVIQQGTDQGHSFYSMQRIDGKPLSTIIANWRQETAESDSDSARRSKTHWHQIAQWMHDAADALETAHQRRILHRDIKPSNLIVDSHQKIWLGDFGLAKDLNQANAESTSAGIGTVQYMSPEGLVSSTTEKSDIYGLGITLYELLARIQKYQKDTPVNLLRRIKEEDAPRLEQIDPSIPKDLVTISQKATAFLPSQRYASAAELRDDLGRFLHGQPILARTTPFRDQCRRWIRNHQALATALAMAAIFLIGMSLLSTYFAIDSRIKQKALELARLAERQSFIDQKIALAHQTALTPRIDNRRKAVSLLHEAFEEMKTLPKGTSSPREPDPDIQRVITQVLSMPELRITPIPEAPTIPLSVNYACDRGHHRILIGDREGKIQLYSMPKWELLYTFDDLYKDSAISLSPDGRFGTLRVNEERTTSQIGKGLECWDLTTSPPSLLWKQENLSLGMGHWNASSTIVYCMQFDGTILGIQPASGQIAYRLEPSGPLYEAVIYPHPTLPMIAVASHYFPEIHFRELETGATLTLANVDRIQSFAWHPSGREFAVSGYDRILRQIQWPTGQGLDEHELNHNGGEVSYSPNGNWMAVSYWGGHVELIHTATRQRLEQPWVWTFFNLHWSSDSRTLGINVLGEKFHRLEIDAPNGIRTNLHDSRDLFSFYSFVFDSKKRLLLANSLISKGNLAVLDLVNSDRFVEVGGSGDRPFFVSVDHEGNYHAIDSDGSVQRTYQTKLDMLPEGGVLRLELQKSQDLAFDTNFIRASGDGLYFFAHPTKEKMFRWPIDSPDQSNTLTTPASDIVDFSDTGNCIVVVDNHQNCQWLIDFQSNQKTLLVDGTDKRAFFSKNNKLVFLSPSNRIYEFNQWDKPIADLPDATCQAAVFSADGKYLVRGEEQSKDIIVYSVDQKKDIFQFSINEGTAKRMWLTDDNAHLIVYIESFGDVGVVVLDFAKLNAQANQEFPNVAYLPPELLPDSRSDTPNMQTRKEPIRRITFEEPNVEPTRPITASNLAEKWKSKKLDAEVIFKELLQEQFIKSQQNKELTEAWDNQDRSGLSVDKLNDIAQALANTERYDDAIAACDLSLQKTMVNTDTKFIKAYSLWQQQSHQKAIEILRNLKEDLAGFQNREFLLKTMLYKIDQSMQNKETHNSQAFLRAVDTWTAQHPIFRLTTIVGDSMAQEGLWNLYKLDLVLANEIVSHNSKLPYHWELVARAKLQVGDQAGARQAIEEYVKLMNPLDYQMLLKLRSKAKKQ